MARKRAIVFAIAILASTGAAFTAFAQAPDGRPVDEPRSELERLYWSLIAQHKTLKQYEQNDKAYKAWFDREDKVIESQEAALKTAKKQVNDLRRSWHTKRNPTCDNGHTYAHCSCDHGRTGKSRLQVAIYVAKVNKQLDQKKLRQTIRTYNKNVKTYHRMASDWRAAHQAYMNDLQTYNRMAKP
jgi:hypothetical protein